jgi:hypothetical protein
MRAKILLVVAAVALTGLIPASPVRAAPSCNNVGLESYDVEVRGLKRSYRTSETIDVTLVVRRKNSDVPVENARAALALRHKGLFLAAIAETNAQGKAHVSLPLRNAAPGVFDMLLYAEKPIYDLACPDVYEYGSRYRRNAVRVRT